MTETIEGVRDPLRVSADHENVVVYCHILPKGHDDIICPVDSDGYVRWPEDRHDAGKPVSWAGYTVLGYDVDPETWGDQYHHPDDCDSIPRCEYCTIAAERGKS